MADYEVIGRRAGEKVGKFLHFADDKLHLFNHNIAEGTNRMGIERKVIGTGLRATSLFILPLIFSEFVDTGTSAMLISSSIKEIGNTFDYIEKIHPLANLGMYVRGIECVFGGAATAIVASYKGSDLFYELGMATLAAGASLTCWASANYIQRKR